MARVRSGLPSLVLLLAAVVASAQTQLLPGDVGVVTTGGVYLVYGAPPKQTVTLVTPATIGPLPDPAIEWEPGTDGFLVAAGERLWRVHVDSVFPLLAVTVTDLSPALPSPGTAELRDLDVDPGTGQVWLLDRANDRALRLTPPLAAGQAPDLVVPVADDVRALAVHTRKYPFALITAEPSRVARQELDGTSTTLLDVFAASGVDIDPQFLKGALFVKQSANAIGYAAGGPDFYLNLNAGLFTEPFALGPQDIEWDPGSGRAYVLAENGVSPLEFPGAAGANHVVRRPLVIGVGNSVPQLITPPADSGIDGLDGDLAVAIGPFPFAEPYGPACPAPGGGPAPLLDTLAGSPGVPALGNVDLALRLSETPALAPTFLVAGVRPLALPFKGCTLLVSPVALLATGATSAGGKRTVPVPLPADPLLAGLELLTQMIVIGSGGQPLLTPGLRLHLDP